MSAVKTFVRDLLHLVYPKVCLSCQSLLEGEENYLCQACLDDFDRFLLPNESTDEMKARLRKHFPEQTVIDDAVSCFRFHKDGKLQPAIHAVKYDGLSRLGVELGMLLGKQLQAERGGEKYDALIALPLHKLKFIERGYNQAERLANGASQTLGLPVRTDAVYRVRYTASQTGYDLAGRQHNMSGAFQCKRVSGLRRVVLIDDVFTTGSTLLACASALKHTGVEYITIATLAVAD